MKGESAIQALIYLSLKIVSLIILYELLETIATKTSY